MGFFVFFSAATSGHLDIIKYAHENGCEFEPTKVSANAAECGHRHILQWVRTVVDPPAAPWDEDACASAAGLHGDCDPDFSKGPHWDVLKWLRTANDPPCPWNAATEAAAKAHFGEAEVASWSSSST